MKSKSHYEYDAETLKPDIDDQFQKYANALKKNDKIAIEEVEEHLNGIKALFNAKSDLEKALYHEFDGTSLEAYITENFKRILTEQHFESMLTLLLRLGVTDDSDNLVVVEYLDELGNFLGTTTVKKWKFYRRNIEQGAIVTTDVWMGTKTFSGENFTVKNFNLVPDSDPIKYQVTIIKKI